MHQPYRRGFLIFIASADNTYLSINHNVTQNQTIRAILSCVPAPKLNKSITNCNSFTNCEQRYLSPAYICERKRASKKANSSRTVVIRTNNLFRRYYPTVDTRIRKRLFENETNITSRTDGQVSSTSTLA